VVQVIKVLAVVVDQGLVVVGVQQTMLALEQLDKVLLVV
jgi:hypothetical protein